MVTKAEILLAHSLVDKSGRTANGLFVAEGHKMIEEVANSSFKIRTIYCTDSSCTKLALPTTYVTTKEMERMSHLKTPTQVLALVEIPRHEPFVAPHDQLVLALDNIQDPGNMGTIIRLADWFGINDIVCSPQTADCFNPKVVQATMGAILRVRVHYADLSNILSQATAARTPIYGTFLEGENIYDTTLSHGGIIVMGNEGRGISATVESHITHRLFIPPYPTAAQSTSESLNVAIATAVVCSEFRRRK